MFINLLWFFLGALVLAGAFFTLYGLTLFVLAIPPGKAPIDKSNVWNRLIAPFYVARHPEIFGGIEFWKKDVGENIGLVQQAVLNPHIKIDIEHTNNYLDAIAKMNNHITEVLSSEKKYTDKNSDVNHAVNLPPIDGLDD